MIVSLVMLYLVINLSGMAVGEWTIFLKSVESTCTEVERRLYSSDSNTLQDFLLRLQANRTACQRIIGAPLESHVGATTSENVRVNLKRLSNAIQTLVDEVERQLFSVDWLTALHYFQKFL